MLVFHTLYTIFKSLSLIGEIIVFLILIAALILNMKTLHNTTAFSPLKLMTWFHAGYHIIVVPFLLGEFLIPGWFIWFEASFSLVSIILIFKELGFLKGLIGILMYWASFFTLNLIVEMFFTANLWGWAIAISIALYLLIFKIIKVKA